MANSDLRDVALLHHELFGDPRSHGHSVATLGPDFLERIFYALNLDNAHFHCDIARVDGRVVGFSVYSTNKDQVFRHLIRQHALRLAANMVGILLRAPSRLGAIISNARYLGGERLAFLEGTPGWWIVAGVTPAYRATDVEQQIGGNVAARLFDRMEERMRELGCLSWYGVVHPENVAINKFLQRRGARLMGTAAAQGMAMRYYVKVLRDGDTENAAGTPGQPSG